MGWGKGRGRGLRRRVRVSGHRSPAARLNDGFSKAPHLRSLWGPECLSQPWKGEGGRGFNLFMAPAALGSGATGRVRPPVGGATSTLAVVPSCPRQGQEPGAGAGGREEALSQLGLEMSQGFRFLLPWITQPHPWRLQAFDQPPSARSHGLVTLSLFPLTVLGPDGHRGCRWRWWW